MIPIAVVAVIAVAARLIRRERKKSPLQLRYMNGFIIRTGMAETRSAESGKEIAPARTQISRILVPDARCDASKGNKNDTASQASKY